MASFIQASGQTDDKINDQKSPSSPMAEPNSIKVLEIPPDYLIAFMEEALDLSRSCPELPKETEIKDDLIEGPDNRDYVRLLNIP